MFTQKCFIRENTPLIRKKLESIGASICGCVEYGIGNCISFNKGIVHKFSFNFEYGETYKPNILKEIENFIDCDHNEELFLAIAALRDDSDIDNNQVFIHKDGNFYKCECDSKIDMWGDFEESESYPRKATVSELIELFNK